MQEKQVTVDGQTHLLSDAFTVVATQNPIEHEGTYPLAEAQLDRFLLQVNMPYPEEEAERAMLRRLHQMGSGAARPVSAIRPVASREQLLRLRQKAHEVQIDEAVIDYILHLVRRSRSLASLSLGASPRAAVMLMQAAKSLALLRGRDFVRPDDVQDMLLPVLRHRVRLTPEAEIQGLTPDACISSLMTEVAVPR
jgi:MoxR-like ATPase